MEVHHEVERYTKDLGYREHNIVLTIRSIQCKDGITLVAHSLRRQSPSNSLPMSLAERFAPRRGPRIFTRNIWVHEMNDVPQTHDCCVRSSISLLIFVCDDLHCTSGCVDKGGSAACTVEMAMLNGVKIEMRFGRHSKKVIEESVVLFYERHFERERVGKRKTKTQKECADVFVCKVSRQKH